MIQSTSRFASVQAQQERLRVAFESMCPEKWEEVVSFAEALAAVQDMRFERASGRYSRRVCAHSGCGSWTEPGKAACAGCG
jgi:hypothetical protein